MLKRSLFSLLSFFLFFIYFTHSAVAAIEWSQQQRLTFNDTPLDMALSANGKFTFVLLVSGEVIIYSPQGKIQGTIQAGKNFNRIESSPGGDRIFLMDDKNNAIQAFTVEYIKELNTSNSPFKGPAQAPVVIAVFSDFQ